jgi:hypothetical protein
MLVLLKLEDVHNYQRQKLKNSKLNKKLKTLCNKTCNAPWVAEIISNKRNFIRGHWDYEHVNYQGTRNVIVSFFLNDNKLYEVFNPKNNERYFCKTENGEIIKQ